MRPAWLMLGLVLLAAAAPAALPPGAMDGFRRYLGFNLPRAFAVGPGGAFGAYGGAGSLAEARAEALRSCARPGCRLYAEDLEVAGVGPAPAPAAPLLAGPGYGFVADPRYVWHGPAAAAGVYVWSHGHDGPAVDNRGLQPPPHVRAFNNAGFDVVRFDREAGADQRRDAMAEALRDGLLALRRQGWRRIVAGGESRGAWNSLQVLATPGAADAVIAVSPAAQGENAGDLVLVQETEFWRLLHDAADRTARVAFVQFDGDSFSADPGRRVAMLDRLLRPRVARLLLIDRPPGFAGHGADATPRFAERYADCLRRFVTDPMPPSGCAGP